MTTDPPGMYPGIYCACKGKFVGVAYAERYCFNWCPDDQQAKWGDPAKGRPYHRGLAMPAEAHGAYTMTKSQYVEAIENLGLTAYSVAAVIGVTKRQSYRYASGDTVVPEPVVRLLYMLTRYGVQEWRT